MRIQGRKDTQTQTFHRESQAWIHHLLGPSTPEILCVRAVFLFELQDNRKHKELWRTGREGGKKQIFVLDFFGFFLSIEEKSADFRAEKEA